VTEKVLVAHKILDAWGLERRGWLSGCSLGKTKRLGVVKWKVWFLD